MKNIKLFAILAAICSFMAVSSCEKKGSETASIEFTIEVTNVAAVTAELSIDGKGTAPALVRYLAPVSKADFLAEVANPDDEAAVKNYISKVGTAIALPYTQVLKDLNVGTEYIIGVVAYDANMNIYGYATSSFTTKEMDDRLVGDQSEAGNLTENIL